MVAAAPARSADESILVWPDMKRAVTVFLNLSTQWRTGMSGLLGLDYQAIRPTADLLGIAIEPRDMLDIRTMERAALGEFERRRRK